MQVFAYKMCNFLKKVFQYPHLEQDLRDCENERKQNEKRGAKISK